MVPIDKADVPVKLHIVVVFHGALALIYSGYNGDLTLNIIFYMVYIRCRINTVSYYYTSLEVSVIRVCIYSRYTGTYGAGCHVTL